MNVQQYNKAAWDRQVAAGNVWTKAVSPQEVERARRGDWNVLLTPTKFVPRDWFPGDMTGLKLLGLASGGGQQGPLFAAAGAEVTIFDNSPAQLEQDRMVGERDGLTIHTEEGDMADLKRFPDASFDLIFHPCSNCFVPDVLPVWREAYRVLKPGGTLLAGLVNPVVFTLDVELEKQGIAQMKYSIPYAEEETSTGEPLSFGHTLEDQLGGQMAAGFHLTGLFEDSWPADRSPIHSFLKCYIATRARKDRHEH